MWSQCKDVNRHPAARFARMTRREFSVLGVCRASWKIWTLADIRAALTNQELALVVTWLRRSERRGSETTMEEKISLLDTRSCTIHLHTFTETGIKRILLERKWVNVILLWSKALCINRTCFTDEMCMTITWDLSCSPNFCLFVDHKVDEEN